MQEVASVSKGDEDFSKALKDVQYKRIREALYKDSKSNGDVEVEGLKKNNDMQTNDTDELKSRRRWFTIVFIVHYQRMQ